MKEGGNVGDGYIIDCIVGRVKTQDGGEDAALIGVGPDDEGNVCKLSTVDAWSDIVHLRAIVVNRAKG